MLRVRRVRGFMIKTATSLFGGRHDSTAAQAFCPKAGSGVEVQKFSVHACASHKTAASVYFEPKAFRGKSLSL
jgi:hypothetical protein